VRLVLSPQIDRRAAGDQGEELIGHNVRAHNLEYLRCHFDFPAEPISDMKEWTVRPDSRWELRVHTIRDRVFIRVV
jgi:hypothetical protein